MATDNSSVGDFDLLTMQEVASILHVSKAHVCNMVSGRVGGCSPISTKPEGVAGQKMHAALARLEEWKRRGGARAGRLIFGLDLTASREATLDSARMATASMFHTIKAIGAIAVKLIYFRGTNECRASQWHDDPGVLAQSMRHLSCESGETQIARLLRLALSEKEKVSGVVFVGDHCEDDRSELRELAQTLGRRSMPLFVFHECSDHDERSLRAKPIFKRMAEASGGVYCEFKPDSGTVLRELLASVAAFAAAGHQGIRQIGPAATPEVRQLQGRLLLLGPASQTKGTP
jgi:hypothetical protein